ncbi:MAG: hypothetical protein HY698_15400 [Deltaproteobacteria bacterium]|nr:hypothetical protein [Deltaproteobacteria bacterium]
MKRIKAGTSFMEACIHCDGLLRTATIRPRADLKSLLRRVMSTDGVISALAIAAPLIFLFLPLVGIFLWLISIAALCSYYFLIIDHVARGRDGLPTTSDALDDWWTIMGHAFRGFTCFLLTIVPTIAWVYFSDSPIVDLIYSPMLRLFLLVIPLLYLPAAIVAMNMTESTLLGLWPVTWIRIVVTAPSAYLRLVGLVAASMVALWLGNLVAAHTLGMLPLLGTMLVASVTNLLLLAQAAIVGGFLHDNAGEFR